jgi:hypothetical protein
MSDISNLHVGQAVIGRTHPNLYRRGTILEIDRKNKRVVHLRIQWNAQGKSPAGEETVLTTKQVWIMSDDPLVAEEDSSSDVEQGGDEAAEDNEINVDNIDKSPIVSAEFNENQEEVPSLEDDFHSRQEVIL